MEVLVAMVGVVAALRGGGGGMRADLTADIMPVDRPHGSGPTAGAVVGRPGPCSGLTTGG